MEVATQILTQATKGGLREPSWRGPPAAAQGAPFTAEWKSPEYAPLKNNPISMPFTFSFTFLEKYALKNFH